MLSFCLVKTSTLMVLHTKCKIDECKRNECKKKLYSSVRRSETNWRCAVCVETVSNEALVGKWLWEVLTSSVSLQPPLPFKVCVPTLLTTTFSFSVPFDLRKLAVVELSFKCMLRFFRRPAFPRVAVNWIVPPLPLWTSPWRPLALTTGTSDILADEHEDSDRVRVFPMLLPTEEFPGLDGM